LPEGSEHHDIVFEGQAVTTGWTGDVINNAGLYLSQLGHGGDHGLETADSGAFDHRAERFGVTGAAMVARKDTFDRVGRLAPSFFAYYEDLDWCWRARLGGYRFTYQPAATVRHHRSATTAQVGAEAMSHLARRNRLLCLVHNAPLPLAVEEIRRDTSQGPDAALRRSLARHLPAALAARVRHPPRGRGRRAAIYRAWAGRDETWGLPSQDAAFRRRMQEAAEQGR
jgi:GT2 family glycosyltransferase